MQARIFSAEPRLVGSLRPPPDKSISHRALLLALLARGVSRLDHLSTALDVAATASMIEGYGASLRVDGSATLVESSGRTGLIEPDRILDLGNSGTGARLGIGVATLVPGLSFFTGDDSLRQRPMGRVIDPLRQLGATISARNGDSYLPAMVRGGGLVSGTVHLSVASAQVKSALLFAALGVDGPVRVVEPVLSRPHTEELFELTGIDLVEDFAEDGEVHGVTIVGPAQPSPFSLRIPGDPSAAAFFVVAAACTPGADLDVEEMYLGPTRTGFLEVLEHMGAHLTREHGRLRVQGSSLEGVEVGGSIIPSLIDEIPILCVAAAFANGLTTIHDAGELRIKETDRIETTAELLTSFGVTVEKLTDGLVVHGGLQPGSLGAGQRRVGAKLDHRIAMAAAILGMLAGGTTEIDGVETVATSYPGFFRDLEALSSTTIELG
ncbi:MAG: 3-phosphoshikimate 1-carboxyvinyltransferase [Ferrimicrobium sp.]